MVVSRPHPRGLCSLSFLSLFSLFCSLVFFFFWLLSSGSNSDDQMGNKEKYEAQSKRALVNVWRVRDMYGAGHSQL
jgi:hypothetical protein